MDGDQRMAMPENMAVRQWQDHKRPQTRSRYEKSGRTRSDASAPHPHRALGLPRCVWSAVSGREVVTGWFLVL